MRGDVAGLLLMVERRSQKAKICPHTGGRNSGSLIIPGAAESQRCRRKKQRADLLAGGSSLVGDSAGELPETTVRREWLAKRRCFDWMEWSSICGHVGKEFRGAMMVIPPSQVSYSQLIEDVQAVISLNAFLTLSLHSRGNSHDIVFLHPQVSSSLPLMPDALAIPSRGTTPLLRASFTRCCS
jgi:hypothetical protein